MRWWGEREGEAREGREDLLDDHLAVIVLHVVFSFLLSRDDGE
jgi:hypothetical protein